MNRLYYNPQNDKIIMVQRLPVSRAYIYSTDFMWQMSNKSPRKLKLIYLGVM